MQCHREMHLWGHNGSGAVTSLEATLMTGKLRADGGSSDPFAALFG